MAEWSENEAKRVDESQKDQLEEDIEELESQLENGQNLDSWHRKNLNNQIQQKQQELTTLTDASGTATSQSTTTALATLSSDQKNTIKEAFQGVSIYDAVVKADLCPLDDYDCNVKMREKLGEKYGVDMEVEGRGFTAESNIALMEAIKKDINNNGGETLVSVASSENKNIAEKPVQIDIPESRKKVEAVRTELWIGAIKSAAGISDTPASFTYEENHIALYDSAGNKIGRINPEGDTYDLEIQTLLHQEETGIQYVQDGESIPGRVSESGYISHGTLSADFGSIDGYEDIGTEDESRQNTYKTTNELVDISDYSNEDIWVAMTQTDNQATENNDGGDSKGSSDSLSQTTIASLLPENENFEYDHKSLSALDELGNDAEKEQVRTYLASLNKKIEERDDLSSQIESLRTSLESVTESQTELRKKIETNIAELEIQKSSTEADIKNTKDYLESYALTATRKQKAKEDDDAFIRSINNDDASGASDDYIADTLKIETTDEKTTYEGVNYNSAPITFDTDNYQFEKLETSAYDKPIQAAKTQLGIDNEDLYAVVQQAQDKYVLFFGERETYAAKIDGETIGEWHVAKEHTPRLSFYDSDLTRADISSWKRKLFTIW